MSKMEKLRGHNRDRVSRKKNILKKSFVVVCILLILLAAMAYVYFHHKVSLLQYDDGILHEDDSSHTEPFVIITSEIDDGMEYMASEVELVDEQEAVPAKGEVLSDSDIFNILLIGTDERTKEFNDNARGDSCILMSINRNTMAVHLVSFERGMGVPILDGEYKGQWDWLTHTFRYGGASLMMREISENFKVDVEYYARTNIFTFIQMIDAAGGVDINLTEAEADYINHPEGTYAEDHIRQMDVEDQIQEVHEGANRLNGATAMLYARCRWIDDDWNRVKRQRNVLASLAERLKTLSLPQIDGMLELVLPCIKTNLTEKEIASLALEMAPRLKEISIEQMTIPEKGTYGSMMGMENRPMFAIDFEKNSKLLAEKLYGR